MDAVDRDVSYHVTAVSLEWDIFSQVGGGEIPQVLTVRVVNGNVVIKHADIDYPIVVLGPDWGRMTAEERGALPKTLAEYDQSPRLREAMEHMAREGIAQITIRWDTQAWDALGRPLGTIGPDETGHISYQSPGQNGVLDDSSGRDMTAGSTAVITINSAAVSGTYEAAKAIMHELRHPVVAGVMPLDEWQVEQDEADMFREVWKTNGPLENDEMRYLEGSTIVGSRDADAASGDAGNDTLSGLTGNDILNGGLGDDLVMGGEAWTDSRALRL